LQGAVFKKFFRGYGDFKGTIREYREEADVYYVTYEDGDKARQNYEKLPFKVTFYGQYTRVLTFQKLSLSLSLSLSVPLSLPPMLFPSLPLSREGRNDFGGAAKVLYVPRQFFSCFGKRQLYFKITQGRSKTRQQILRSPLYKKIKKKSPKGGVRQGKTFSKILYTGSLYSKYIRALTF
jgi:hypothetical protein